MKNKVLLLLSVLLAVTLWGLPLITHAPNRIVTPTGLGLAELSDGSWFFYVLVGVVCVIFAVAWFTPSRWSNGLAYIAAVIGLAVGFAYVGQYALVQTGAVHLDNTVSTVSAAARISMGGGFWLMVILLGLVISQTARGMSTQSSIRALWVALAVAPILVLAWLGYFRALSMAKEYASNKQAFDAALTEHLTIVGLTLLVTLMISIPLGIWSYRQKWLGQWVINVLSFIQTIPSIALFAILLAPLAALSERFTWLADIGVKGIGTAPAVIALTLYSLLPMVRAIITGLAQVSPMLIESAKGMGMTRAQILRQVQVRLALPVIVSGLRVTTVQAIGLTMVAALIGAGGFGSIMFRGLAGSAIDLVLLGVLPVVALAVLADALFKWLSLRLEVVQS